MRRIICIAGFGDNASMFEGIVERSWHADLSFLPIDLPGFGSNPLEHSRTSLEALAEFVVETAHELGADTVLAHSVASIVGSLAALESGSPISCVLSLEGNLTQEDAYYSGTAARYDSAKVFHRSFLGQLNEQASANPIISRYAKAVELADPKALWELGCDAFHFSARHVPGDLLRKVERSLYLFNPMNLPQASLNWLSSSQIECAELTGASHWASVDQPDTLCKAIERFLAQ